ncbi:MAG: ROK family protein [Ancalomicrobiaceae bacterium]|nr:ROK family protein [Ancalomicrobiaceae bacterium]
MSLVAGGQARSRADLTSLSGLSRNTIVSRLKALLDAGLLREAEETMRSGGRPTRMLAIGSDFGVILAADIGETSVRLAVTDLTPAVIVDEMFDVELAAGPEVVLGAIAERFANLLGRCGRSLGEAIGIGLSLPAPVDYASGRVFGPSIMTNWDDFDIRTWLQDRLGVPVLGENDVNLLTLYEWRTFWQDVGHLFFIKFASGIGSGIISDGRIYRGAQGAAGDIGHIQLASEPKPLCRCGKLGCVEARAAGWALARDLRAQGVSVRGSRDVVRLVHGGHGAALEAARKAGQVLGEVTADVVSVLNPGIIVIGGTLAAMGSPLFEEVDQVVRERVLPLAKRDLRIEPARSGGDAGLLGAALLVKEVRLSAADVEATIARFAANA